MKGRIAVLDQVNGRKAAALIVDGRLEDILIDPADDAGPRPGAIYRALADRPLKGRNGLMLKLGDGAMGFLKQSGGVRQGRAMLVQIATQSEPGKAAPATTRLLFKGRYAILTPDAPGLNVARSIRDEDERLRLADIAGEAMREARENAGLIVRSAAAETDRAAIAEEIGALLEICRKVTGDQGDAPALLLDAPSADYLAWRDWADPEPDQVFEGPGAFADHGVFEMLEELASPLVRLSGDASMFIEQTRALVAVDVNTGGDFSLAAGLKANLAAARDLPRQLRLRGLGGQITVDFAPMGKKDRRALEQALKRALKADGVDTIVAGWTPLGHLELQRKRERAPLAALLA